MLRKIMLTALMLTIAGAAAATALPCEVSPPFQAPELDPSSLIAGLTLLAGGLAMLRGRKKGGAGE
jgi:LPXTG-motif cell wall-anchored protein